MTINKNTADKLSQLHRLESMRAVKVNQLQQISLYWFPITALCDIREGQILCASVCVEFSGRLKKHLFYSNALFCEFFNSVTWFEKEEMRVCPKTKVSERASLC